MNPQKKLLNRLLLQPVGKSRLRAALIALFTGIFLFLSSVLLWWNFNELLHGKNSNDALAATYIVIAKKVTDANMGNPVATLFSDRDVQSVAGAPGVEEVGEITANRFPVYAMMGGELGFATEMPLECVPDKFLDNLPADWAWKPGDKVLPIIISSQFLDIYNYVFAPGQGLPQLSESTVKSLNLRLKVGSEQHGEMLLAHVVGFSDRIGSVIAPRSFIDYGNSSYGASATSHGPSQLVLRVSDPSDTHFTAFLDQHDYRTNPQNLRWSRIRGVVDVVVAGTGLLALCIVGTSMLVIILFIQLTIARARESLTLLLQIGYSPSILGRFLAFRFLPLLLAAAFTAFLAASALQYWAATHIPVQGIRLPLMPGTAVWAAFVVVLVALLSWVWLAIRKAVG